MKLLMLTGSPHPQGTTNLLAEHFVQGLGAEHQISRFDCAKMVLNPCHACSYCRKQKHNSCLQKDDMGMIYEAVAQAEAVVFVTPLYYFGMSAQLKIAIDRFYAVNAALKEKARDVYLLAACADEEGWAMDALKQNFEIICHYLKWHYKGSVLAFGCPMPEVTALGEYALAARALAAQI